MPSREEEAINQARQKALGFNIILVTGGSGYIGSHTVLELLVAGYAVVVIDNLSNSHWESLVRVHWIVQQDFTKRGRSPGEVPPLFFHEVDITDREAMQGVFETWKTDEPAATERKPLIKFAEEKILKKEKKIVKSVPKDIGALAVKQHFKCQEFSASSTQSQLPAERPTKIKVNDVIHFAALKSVGESVSQPLNYYRTNVGGLINLLELMKQYNVKNIVFSSSAVVYGKGKETNIREDSVQVGGGGSGGGLLTNPYGRSKWMDEEILNDTSVSDPEMQVIALRYFNPTGSHPSGLIGEDPRGTPNNIIPVVMQAFQRRRSKVYVYGSNYDTPDGTGVRDYIHVLDLARGHLAALRKLTPIKAAKDAAPPPPEDDLTSPISPTFARRLSKASVSSKSSIRGTSFSVQRTNYRCYNLGTGTGHSVLDILKAFSNVCGNDIPFVLSDARTGDLGTVTADVSKASSELGWYAEFGLQDMCRDVYQWAVDNPQGYERLRRLSMMAQVDPDAVRQIMETVEEEDEDGEAATDTGSARSSADFGNFIRRLSVMTIDDSKYKNVMRKASVAVPHLGNLLEEEEEDEENESSQGSRNGSFSWNTPFKNDQGQQLPSNPPFNTSSNLKSPFAEKWGFGGNLQPKSQVQNAH
ncbi:hypothetical protein AOL_s00043g765 [Orbilia oligospora ATCC 24927]|uniref:NAD-dependent epimerase/dehydratase domain-containing protein n=2 Tax=Orbilia oligospora TaxID=2813651 RepID=G1X4Z1_ARTOA|nr:hypothetical protein AOL_s00043g765 [Orbilia oligospora ATCC 24927]EGX51746.1 hypothetical protein AOL_s00043g765 [Orbilia oligospora ATCC 24927]KAF3272501.1 hypothetical protein TWF970_010002 [Orbilia oligospora]